MGRLQRRLTSNNATIDFLPCKIEQLHKEVLDFRSASGGTFRLRVNGEETADITFAAIATLITNINSALDALAGLTSGELVASGTSTRAVTVTSSGNEWYRVELLNVASLTGGAGAYGYSEQVGATTLRIQDVVMKMDISIDVKDTEAAAIDEFEDFPQPISSGMNFNLSMYFESESPVNLPLALEGLTGRFTIYNDGDAPGKTHFTFDAMVNSINVDYPFRDKIEIKIGGKRQGIFVDPFGTINK